MTEDLSARILIIEFWVFIVPISLLYFVALFWTIGSGLNLLEFTLPLIVHGLALVSAWIVIIEFASDGRTGLRHLNKWWYFFPCISGLCVVIATFGYITSFSGFSMDNENWSILAGIAFTSIYGLLVMPPFIHILIETYYEYR